MKHSYICPKCGEKLYREGNSFRCGKGHCYDIARSGYVNLLLPQQMNAKLPGDNKLMVNSRRSFLDKGYYAPIMEAFCEEVRKYASESELILDAGCGEGYYTVSAAKAVPDCFFMGTDISKTAADAAAKRARAAGAENIFFSVSSVFHLPVESGSCGMLTTLFAPYCGEEFQRVLRKGGIMIMVIPSERHLMGLKEAVYDSPYLNEVKSYALEGFELAGKTVCEGEIFLESNEDILDLFSMTPYYYKTGREGHERLKALESLVTEIGAEILVYRKN